MSTANRGFRLRGLELALIVLLPVAITATFVGSRARASRVADAAAIPSVPPVSAEVAWLARTYGPDKQSQYVEEWIVRDFFQDRRDGVFIDIGAADYKQYSNTWFLETARGWSGLAIDAQASYAADYTTHRPRTRFESFFVSDRSDDQATLYVNSTKWVASDRQSFTARWSDQTTPVQVATITLDDLLPARAIEHFDFLSLDIELAEPRALAGFDIERFKPSLVCIEAHPEVRQSLLDYFHQHGYVVIGKYLRMDDRNLYFMPAGHSLPALPPEVMAEWTEDGPAR